MNAQAALDLPTPAPLLAWSQASRYHLQSDCGRYHVAKVSVRGVIRYEAWLRAPAQLLGIADTADLAKRHAQTHHDGASNATRT